jgi:hypothetical protein
MQNENGFLQIARDRARSQEKHRNAHVRGGSKVFERVTENNNNVLLFYIILP